MICFAIARRVTARRALAARPDADTDSDDPDEGMNQPVDRESDPGEEPQRAIVDGRPGGVGDGSLLSWRSVARTPLSFSSVNRS